MKLAEPSKRLRHVALGLKRVIGLVLPENLASIRVLEKIGMRFDGMIDFCGDRAQRWVAESP